MTIKFINKDKLNKVLKYVFNIFLVFVNPGLEKLRQLVLDEIRPALIGVHNSVVNYFKKVYLKLKVAKSYLKEYKKVGKKACAINFISATKDSLRRNKLHVFRTMNVAAPVLAVFVLFITVGYFSSRTYALVVDCNGQTVCAVENEQTFGKAVNKINGDLTAEATQKADISLTPQFKLEPVSQGTVSEPDTVKNIILNNSDTTIQKANGLYINGHLVGCIKEGNTMQNMLDNALTQQEQNNQGTRASFYDNVTTKEGIFPIEDIKTDEQMKQLLSSTRSTDVSYTIKDGDTIESISSYSNMSVDSILRKNPNIDPQMIIAGSDIMLEKQVPFLSIQLTKRENYNVIVPYQVETLQDENEYIGFSVPTQEGKDGTAACTDDVSYLNGVEVGRTSIERNVVVEPIKEVSVVGTKETPTCLGDGFVSEGGTGVSTGQFMWPVPFTHCITSTFGPRWGTFHKGIDISTPGVNGKVVAASDGGVVMQASDISNGYGKCIIIQHGGVYSTLYGHCSSIYVNVGQRVSKGQPIAAVGSTGNSTGPHLHFEVMINRGKVDPQGYVK